jgi:hypothetical protein
MAPIRRIVITVAAKIRLEFSAMTNHAIPVSDDRLVWYAVYGSNLLRRRFDCYIQGGNPDGATREYPGCRDKTAPRDARRLVLAHSLYFAERSESWGGAIVFVRRTVSGARTYGRMYLITYGQFNDVVRQENGRDVPGSVVVPSFEAFARADHWEIDGFRLYGGVIKIGARHGHPILSLTAAHENHEVGAPSEAYVKTIVSGLEETYPCMRKSKIFDYLARTQGIHDAIPADTLNRWVLDC